jgi:DNA glycosylase AlkZ-like
MAGISLDKIRAYRVDTFRILPGKRVKSREEAVDFVNERGFIYFWPISGIILPNLWSAVAGDRPVADAHDDPGHVTWGWKDSLLGERAWYYAKILRKKATMVSLQVAPTFYALSENYGAYDEDYLTLYEQGRLTLEAKTLYETLLDKGPLDTVALRKAARMTSAESNSRFERSLSDLQANFMILPTAVTQAGAWHYAFAYDVTARYYPELVDQAHGISEKEARRSLTERYFLSVGAAQLRDVVRLFGWNISQAENAVQALVQQGMLERELDLVNQPGEWIALKDLV